MFSGIFPAIPTPFAQDRVDVESLKLYIAWLMESGVHGIVACGTTGEMSALGESEYREVLLAARAATGTKVPLIAGCSANTPQGVLRWAHIAESVGVEGLMVVAPYYNRPSQQGLYEHFKAVAAATKTPIILYNIPSRTGVKIETSTIVRLAEIESVVGIKDATGDLEAQMDLVSRIRKPFSFLSGTDELFVPYMAVGGTGCISVVGCADPRRMIRLWQATASPSIDRKALKEEFQGLLALKKAVFYTSSPAPIKYILSRMGLMREEVRLPIVSLNPGEKETVDGLLSTAGFSFRRNY